MVTLLEAYGPLTHGCIPLERTKRDNVNLTLLPKGMPAHVSKNAGIRRYTNSYDAVIFR
jgi:hypothetical protein